jgi:thioester reductase-like protein
VGSELLKLLRSAKPDRHIAVLTRQVHKIPELKSLGVVALQGDIIYPSLALDYTTYGELKESIEGIIHCAADTRFSLPLNDARAINVEGTRNLLRFAHSCRRLGKFAHLSTIYVVGKATGHFLEAPTRHQSSYLNTYQQSKHEAEELVTEAMNHLPACIFRLSSIIGDSRTGEVGQFNHFHRLIRLFPRNPLPMIPASSETRVDLIASDWAVSALAALFDSDFVPGRFYHICAGPGQSLTVEEMIDAMRVIFEKHPIARRWLPIRIPEFVSLDRYEHFVERNRRSGDALLNELLRVLGYFLPHLALFQVFDNQETLKTLAKSGLGLPSTKTNFEKVVRYCLETNWGSRCANPSDQRLAERAADVHFTRK